ncbi:hypothetical protein Naga_100261g6 [Nannochloropsis gaditana]|uniref:Uncharacterized protein n=1 Tax=Nannochloropsis gaditana TaxID=72520 RepID=W7T1V4_9STRA|nr:hypothetical protein Naga_100261g6 [Nannochloropsis gaditana]
MESLRAVLEQGPQSLQMVYVVSGRDVPLQPPAVLFSTHRTHTEGRPYLIHPGRSILCKAERRWQRALKSKVRGSVSILSMGCDS